MSTRLGITALVVYIIGGIAAFIGMGLLIFVGDDSVNGWGTGTALGYLFLFVGAGLSILGVLLMRIFRNRFPVIRMDEKNSVK